MNLQYRIDLLARLGEYILSDDTEWQAAKEKAFRENGWFIPEFIDLASGQIARSFLKKDLLKDWVASQQSTANSRQTTVNSQQSTVGSLAYPKKVGIVMAGNIPLVGFHDWLCVFISGHSAMVKTSSKDKTLIEHLTGKIGEWNEEAGRQTVFSEMLKGCDAYIATGSNNSSRYFEYYFAKYPHIIRRNRTAVAILDGDETKQELEKLADDVYQYFGLGCRNVTKIYVPEGYDFVPLLEAFKKYDRFKDHNKYANNLDYNLALLILNKKYYMSNGSILLLEDPSLFSPIAQLHYEFYSNRLEIAASLENPTDLQCIVGHGNLGFGEAQNPSLGDWADGVNTLAFLAGL